MIEIWIIAAGTSLIIALAPWYILRDFRRAKLALHFREKFHECATVVLENDATPLQAINILEAMQARIDSPYIVRSFLYDVFSGRLREVMREHRGNLFSDALPPEVRAAFNAATMHFMFAVSFSAPITGPIMFRILLVFAKEAQETTAAVTMWEVEKAAPRYARHFQEAA